MGSDVVWNSAIMMKCFNQLQAVPVVMRDEACAAVCRLATPCTEHTSSVKEECTPLVKSGCTGDFAFVATG
jgi:hypothetical protein